MAAATAFLRLSACFGPLGPFRAQQPCWHLQLAGVEADDAVALVFDVGGLGVNVAGDGALAQLVLEGADAVGARLRALGAAVVGELLT